VLSKVLELGSSTSFQCRQLFIHTCKDIALHGTHPGLPPPKFLEALLPPLAALSADPVPNVRIALARQLPLLPDWVLTAEGLQPALGVLVMDPNRDVKVGRSPGCPVRLLPGGPT
jgi:hypothetical protein